MKKNDVTSWYSRHHIWFFYYYYWNRAMERQTNTILFIKQIVLVLMTEQYQSLSYVHYTQRALPQTYVLPIRASIACFAHSLVSSDT